MDCPIFRYHYTLFWLDCQGVFVELFTTSGRVAVTNRSCCRHKSDIVLRVGGMGVRKCNFRAGGVSARWQRRSLAPGTPATRLPIYAGSAWLVCKQTS